jgi:hypothetical protein
VFLARNISHVNADLTIFEFTQATAPLPRDPDRHGTLLGESGGVENDDAVRFAEFHANLGCEGVEQWLVVPGNESDKLLDTLTFLIVEVSDSFAGFAFEFGEESGDIFDCVSVLLGSA